jgi:hypothetical protein
VLAGELPACVPVEGAAEDGLLAAEPAAPAGDRAAACPGPAVLQAVISKHAMMSPQAPANAAVVRLRGAMSGAEVMLAFLKLVRWDGLMADDDPFDS